ncbi:MAG: hypothetical protein JJT81_09390 [Rubellimicrobium sp.]|nr:hypothetical protein [Rubellimicrobium sp.]
MVGAAAELATRGWTLLPREAGVARWAVAARVLARSVTADPAMQARWLRHGGTWFVGVDALPNGPDGTVDGVPLPGAWRSVTGWTGPLHPAQLSVVHPGYPGRDPDESEAQHRFRRDRDAAHLDGLLPEGPGRRRFLREPHAFIAGFPLTEMTEETGPFVVWDGSHAVIRAALGARLAGVAPDEWAQVDLTDLYMATRRRVFETCPRRVVTAQPGETILAHRLSIHGVGGWADGVPGPEGGRMIVWFRPILPDPGDWLAEG